MSAMDEFKHEEGFPAISEQKVGEMFNAVMTRVYGWMTLGLLVTTITSFIVAMNPRLLITIYSNTFVYWGLFIGMFILVIAITRAASKLASGVALGLFFLYAALMGVWLSMVIILFYNDPSAVTTTFAVTTVVFVLLSVLGLTTKQDLTRWGPILLVGLVGIILASLLNIFLGSDTLYWVITYVGILLFMGLIVYDSQRIKKMTQAAAISGRTEGQVVSSIGVLGALSLYLDFINLFLLLLRLFSRR